MLGHSRRSAKTDYIPRDHYAEVTAQVVAALEAGTAPWRKPRDPDKTGGPAMPRNATTDARYRGINVLTGGPVAAEPKVHSSLFKQWVCWSEIDA